MSDAVMTNESALFARAQAVLPGGVNSPVRAFKAVGGEPIFFKSARGAVLVAEDGREFIDLYNSWGPMILGHGHPAVVEAVREQAARAMSFGAPTALEVELAELVVELVPGIEMVRMVSSGTEACLSAVRLARAATGRDLIIKFEGCYHGHADAFLSKAGSGAATLGVPTSPGVPAATAAATLNARFNDLASVAALLEAHPRRVAAIIVEPVVGNMGCVPPQPGFLQGLRALCDAHDVLLILDEVMTGFRLALGGAQELYSVRADLTCLGKVLGGGLPVGAYGGRRDLMQHVAPLGPMYQAGTLSGNPLGMAAGLATLRVLKSDPSIHRRLEFLGAEIESGLREAIARAGVPACVQRVGSMLSVFFTPGPVQCWEDADRCDRAAFARFFQAMLDAGFALPPAQFEAWFLSAALEDAHMEGLLKAAGKALGG